MEFPRPELALVEHQLAEFGRDMRDVQQAMSSLVALGERQTALLDKMTEIGNAVRDHEVRLRTMEVHQPQLRETRNWVIAAVSAVLTALLTFGGGVVLDEIKAQRLTKNTASNQS